MTSRSLTIGVGESKFLVGVSFKSDVNFGAGSTVGLRVEGVGIGVGVGAGVVIGDDVGIAVCVDTGEIGLGERLYVVTVDLSSDVNFLLSVPWHPVITNIKVLKTIIFNARKLKTAVFSTMNFITWPPTNTPIFKKSIPLPTPRY